MRLRFGGEERVGRALSLRGTDADADADAETVLAAVRDPDDGRARCRSPGPAHEHVGHLHEGMALDLPSALAAAARSRGHVAPQDEELASLDPETAERPPDPADARRRLAEAEADVTALRERTERLGGHVEARRKLGAPVDDAERQHRAAARELADAETERVAAEQVLDHERAAARRARDARQDALRVADRRRNLERAARDHLVERVADAFERALRAVPGSAGGVVTHPEAYDGPTLPAAFAVARLARIRAPLVVEAGPFERPARAAACLDAPVLLI